MRNHRRLLVVAVMLAITAASAGALASFEITPKIDTMLPEDTIAYMQVYNPEELLESVDSFMAATELNMFTGGMPLRQFIEMMLSSKEGALSLDYLNLENPAGFAVTAPETPEDEDSEPGFILFMPLNTSFDIFEFLGNTTESEDFQFKVFRNYLVIFNSQSLKDRFPYEKTVDLNRLDRYPDDSLNMYLSFDQLFSALNLTPEDLKLQIELMLGDESELTRRIILGYIDLLAQLDNMYYRISMDSTGLSFASDILFKEKMEELLLTLHEGKDLDKWEQYLPEDSLFQAVYSIDNRDILKLEENLITFLMDEDENSSMLREYFDIMKKFSGFVSEGGAFSMDLQMETGAKTKQAKNQQNYEDETAEAALPFTFSISIISGLTDGSGFAEALLEYYNSQMPDRLTDAMMKDYPYQIRMTVEEMPALTGERIFRFSYNIDEKKTKSRELTEEELMSINLLKSMDIWYMIRDDRLFAYFGPDGRNNIRKAAEIKAGSHDWIERAPEGAVAAWDFSFSRLFKILDGMPEFQGMGLSETGDMDMTGYSGIENGSIYGGSLLDSESVRNFMYMFLNMQGM